MPTVAELFAVLSAGSGAGGAAGSTPVTGIEEDSRLVRPGNLFVARAGTRTDGSRFIGQAVERGAVAIVSATPIADCPVPVLVVDDAGASTSKLAHAYFGEPSDSVSTVGITGTNGKTTTAYLLRHVLNHFNIRCGLMGTVETDDGQRRWESDMTTPSATEVARLMSRMRDAGCQACAMETSSHSLDQGRVAGVRYAGAVFTNLTGDHLDYHKTMQAYAAAKASMFRSLAPEAVAAVNAGDPWADFMVQKSAAKIYRFGFTSACDYRAVDPVVTAAGSRFILHTPDGRAEIATRLIGKHNIENALAAATILGEVFGLTVHQVAAGLKEAAGAPGRLQTVDAGQPFAVLVDYAHTDDALRNVLTALRPLTRGRLRVLFGCGGDRDKTKRPRMAAVAQELADEVYITSDNPRTEEPGSILDQIFGGFTGGYQPALVEADRRSAIEQILADARPGDVVLIAGKGHENYQIVGTTKHPFDDAAECRRVIGGRTAMA
jgi:UDP-N-acetylmuramoyl-L-alanyl-D-glutamate--2,6-diaminopimelate ligase